MSSCVEISDSICSYVNITSDNENHTVFTWWMTLGRDPNNSTKVTCQVVTLFIITVIAVIANIIVFVVIMSDKKIRSIPTHQYAATLCIDFLSFISISPMLLLSRKLYTWTRSVTMCKMILYIFSVAGFNAIWIFVLISMDRYIQIVDSVQPTKLAKIYPKNPNIAIWVISIFSILYCLPLALNFNIYPVIENECTNASKCFMDDEVDHIEICAIIWSSTEAAAVWFAFLTTLGYLVPLVLMCYNYWQVFLCVRKVGKRIQRQTRSQKRADSKKAMEVRVTRMCALLVTLYILMWTPIFIVLYLVQFSRVHQQHGSVSSDDFFWIFIITLANAMINPIFYALLNKKFVKSWEEYRCTAWDFCKDLSLLRKISAAKRVEPESGEAISLENSGGNDSSSPNTPQKYSMEKKSVGNSDEKKFQVSVVITPPPDD